MPDRHREKPLSLRLGADQQRLEAFARTTGQPVRRVIADAVKAWLDRHDRSNAMYNPGQQVWYTPWCPSWEDQATWPVTYVRLDDDGHVVRFPDGGMMTLLDSELSPQERQGESS